MTGARAYMRCPECGFRGQGNLITDTVTTDEHGDKVWRRRSCGKCSKRWTTYEVDADYLEILEKKAMVEIARMEREWRLDALGL